MTPRLEDLLGYLPPHVEGSLIRLMNESPPDRQRISRDEWKALEFRRLFTLEHLHGYFDHDPHQTAVDLVRSGNPFGLYLRNFDLGGRLAPETVRGDDEAVERITSVSIKDLQFARTLHERLRTSLPVVAVANPAFDDWGESAARLYLRDDDWFESVMHLVGWASVIVVFVSDAQSAGLERELAAIVKAGRTDATVAVVPRGIGIPVEGVRYIDRDEADERVEELVNRIARSGQGAVSADRATWNPQRRMAPEFVREHFKRFALAVMDEANELLERGDGVTGLDSLYRGLGIVTFVHDEEGRAAFVATIARVYRHILNERASAETCYRLSEALWGKLAKSDPANEAFARAYKTLQHEHSELKKHPKV